MAGKIISENPVYFLGGGGTAGHVNPAIQVANALRIQEPEAEIYFLVTQDGLEKDLVERAGYPSFLIKASALPSKLLEWPGFIYKTMSGILTCLSLFKKHKPKVVLGTGGYVSAALILAAKLAGIPSYLHEQNALPGKTNRFLSKFSEGVFLSFPDSEKYFRVKKPTLFVRSGNPVHPDFFDKSREDARNELGIPKDTLVILCLGGSLGARSINEAVVEMVKAPNWTTSFATEKPVLLVLSAGKINQRFIKNTEVKSENLIIQPYLNTKIWVPAADILITRAGAGSLAEQAAAKKPSILIPFPEAADNHQKFNARVFEEAGASIMIEDRELAGETLTKTINKMISNTDLLINMQENAAKLGKPEAALNIAKLMINTNENKDKSHGSV